MPETRPGENNRRLGLFHETRSENPEKSPENKENQGISRGAGWERYEPSREVAQLLLAVIVTAVLGVHVVHGAHLEWEQHSTGAVQAAAMVYRPVYRPLHARDIRRLIRG